MDKFTKEITKLYYKLIVFSNEYTQMEYFLYLIKLEELLVLTKNIIDILGYNKCDAIHYKTLVALYKNLNKMKAINRMVHQKEILNGFIAMINSICWQYKELK